MRRPKTISLILATIVGILMGLALSTMKAGAEDCPFTWKDVKDDLAFTWGECPATDQLIALIKKHRFAICDRQDSFITCLPPTLKNEEYLNIRWVALKAQEDVTECELIMWWIDDKPAFLTRNDVKRMVYDVKKLIENIPNAHPACGVWHGWR